jgi:ribosomal protein L2
MDNQVRRRFNLLERRIERLEELVGPVDNNTGKYTIVNSGDWLTLESVCIGDIVGGVEIKNERQVNVLRKAGEALKILSGEI